MGGRKTILKGSYNFEKYSNNNKIAKEIVNFFDDISVFSFFYKNLNNLKKKILIILIYKIIILNFLKII